MHTKCIKIKAIKGQYLFYWNAEFNHHAVHLCVNLASWNIESDLALVLMNRPFLSFCQQQIAPPSPGRTVTLWFSFRSAWICSYLWMMFCFLCRHKHYLLQYELFFCNINKMEKNKSSRWCKLAEISHCQAASCLCLTASLWIFRCACCFCNLCPIEMIAHT